MKTSFRKLPKSEVEIDFEMDAEEFGKHAEGALLRFKESVKLDGFRHGHAPLNMVEQKVGSENLLMEAGDSAIKDAYGKFMAENNLEPIGSPKVKITKIAKGSPFEFKVKAVVLPEIKLPDYKKIATGVKSEQVSVDNKEVEESLAYLQKSRAKFSQVDRGAEKKDFVEIEYQNERINGGKAVKDKLILDEGGFMKEFENNLLGMKAGEEKEFMAKFPENTPDKTIAGKESNFKVKIVSVQKMELPPLDDEFAKVIGHFGNLAALKDNLKEGIVMEKSEAEKQRKRSEIMEKIAEKVFVELPEKMIDYETQRLLENMKNQITQGLKISFEEYLASIIKTEEEIRKSFVPQAEKRLKESLILREIGKTEQVKASKEETEEEMNKIIKNYSKNQIEKIDIAKFKEYTEKVIANEKIFQLLEKLSR